MKQRYRLFRRRGGVFYTFDNATGKQISLKTADEAEAERLLAAKNEAERQPAINMQIAKAYLDSQSADKCELQDMRPQTT